MPERVAERVTRGDATAVLNAFPNAGRVIRRQGVVKMNTPADPNLKATIRPFSATVFDGKHYCVEDWHVIVVAYLDGGGNSFTRQDAEASLGQTAISLTLDGALLTGTTRTPIKNLGDPAAADPSWSKGFVFQQGNVMSPDALAVGVHNLSFTAVYPGGQDQDSIMFEMDPAGQGACR